MQFLKNALQPMWLLINHTTSTRRSRVISCSVLFLAACYLGGKSTLSAIGVLYCIRNNRMISIHVIAWAGVKLGINFTSCSENVSEIARGAADCNFAIFATSGIYSKISLLPVLS